MSKCSASLTLCGLVMETGNMHPELGHLWLIMACCLFGVDPLSSPVLMCE